VFLDQLLRQGTLTRWLVQRRHDHRASLGLPVGAFDPVERMFGKPLRAAAAAQLPASGGADPAAPTEVAAGAWTAKEKRKPVGTGGSGGGMGALEQLPQYWTVHMDQTEAATLGLLHRVNIPSILNILVTEHTSDHRVLDAYMLLRSFSILSGLCCGRQGSLTPSYTGAGPHVSMCCLQEHPVMGTHAPGRVMSMIKQQAAMLTHHQWAQVRTASPCAQPG